jgi:hypothetical protein
MGTLKKVMAISLILPAVALADYQSELESLSTRDLTVAESALIVELKERADQSYKESKISRFAATEGKRVNDKKTLIESTLKLIAAKLELNARVTERKLNPSFNDKAAIALSDIKIQSDTGNDFDHATTLPVKIIRGDIQKSSIISDSVNFPLPYRITYSESGTIRVQGVTSSDMERVSFITIYEGSEYKVSATIKASFSGWN